MKRIILSLLILSSFAAFAQKEQVPDALIWSNRRYAVTVERDVPSIVMVYFQRSGSASPFTFWSSNLGRGHIARYEILNNSLYLTAIEAKRFRTRAGNLWTESGIDTLVTPSYFDIKPLETPLELGDENVIADWYSGIVELTLLPSDKKEAKSDEAKGKRYLHVVNGKITENMLISPSEQARLEKTPQDPSTMQATDILSMRKRYISYYSRCAMDREQVDYNGHQGLFEHQSNGTTLVLERFGNNPLRTRSNWEETDEACGAPFGTWTIRNDSLFVSTVSTHHGSDAYEYEKREVELAEYFGDDAVKMRDGKPCVFADWIDGNYVIHYGTWEKTYMDLPTYNVSKTQKVRIKNGIILSSDFAPSSFEEDEQEAAASNFNICNESAIWSVDDRLLAESVGSYKQPKTNPSYKGDKPTFRSWFLNHPLTDERAKDRLFRVKLAFMVNCQGEPGRWQIISKGKGELMEFATMVLDLVKTMPQNWIPAKDKKGNPVDCWQIVEFTVSNGILTNGNYK